MLDNYLLFSHNRFPDSLFRFSAQFRTPFKRSEWVNELRLRPKTRAQLNEMNFANGKAKALALNRKPSVISSSWSAILFRFCLENQIARGPASCQKSIESLYGFTQIGLSLSLGFCGLKRDSFPTAKWRAIDCAFSDSICRPFPSGNCERFMRMEEVLVMESCFARIFD